MLPELLDALSESYYILDIEGVRQFSIENHYFDTEHYLLFIDHVNGKKNRYKIRFRTYVESNTSYMEIKHKNNKKKVNKYREPQDKFEEKINGNFKYLTFEKTSINPEHLELKLKVCYQRITLLHKSMPEKLTLDYDLYFKNSVNDNDLRNLAIAEVKYPKKNQNSQFSEVIGEYGIKPDSFSKYCIGTVLTVPDVKYNRLKKKLISINKICKNNSGQS